MNFFQPGVKNRFFSQYICMKYYGNGLSGGKGKGMLKIMHYSLLCVSPGQSSPYLIRLIVKSVRRTYGINTQFRTLFRCATSGVF
jgi:hypothetical protein